MTTLEEVFLRLGEEEEISSLKTEVCSETILLVDEEAQEREEDETEPETFMPVSTSDKSGWRQFRAMVAVRVLNKLREPSILFVQIVLPVIYICLGIYLQSGSPPKTGSDTDRHLSPTLYINSYTPALFGVQNVTEDFNDFIEEFTGSPVLDIDTNVDFKDLISQNLMGVIKRKSDEELIAYFNSSAQHSMPVMINLITNYYSSLASLGNISLSTQSWLIEGANVETGEIFKTFGACFFIGMAYVIAPLGMALELIYDRSVGLKNQLRVNGLSTFLYYGSVFFVLGLMMILLLVMMIIVIVAFNVELLMIPSAALVLYSMYLVYTLPCLIFVGCLSFMFNTMESGQNIFLFSRYFPSGKCHLFHIFNFSLAGIIPFIIVSFIEILGILDSGWSPLLPQTLHLLFAFISPIYIPFGVIFYLQKVYIQCSLNPLLGCDTTSLTLRFGSIRS